MSTYSTIPIQKTKSIYLKRLEGFLANDEKAKFNINGMAYVGKVEGTDSIRLEVYSPGADHRPSFGEAVKANYNPTSVSSRFGPSWSTHWFRIHVRIPPTWDTTSNTIEFLWKSQAEGLVWTSDGEPVHGLSGQDRFFFDLRLVHPAPSGEWFTFYIELACNAMFGNGKTSIISPPAEDRTYELEEVALVQRRPDALKLKGGLLILYDLIKYHGENSPIGSEGLFIATKIIDTFDHTNVESLKDCLSILEDYHCKNGKKHGSYRIAAVGNCHIDTAWLWRFQETRRKVARSFLSQLELIRQFPEYVFTASQMQQFEWLKTDYPALFKRIQESVRSGNFIPIGGSWVEMDGNLPSGESFARQFLYGQRFMKEHFGFYSDVFWLPDTFGYNAQLPQLIRLAGMKYFMTTKLSWNNINKFPHSSFWWAGLDGTKVLAHFPPSGTYTSAVKISELIDTEKENKDRDRSHVGLLLFGHGDGGGGPTKEMIERLDAVKAYPGIPSVDFTGPKAFYKNLEVEGQELLTWEGELYFELHRGTFTSQARAKYHNRRCEVLLIQAEMLSAMNGIVYGNMKEKYPAVELEDLWKEVLLNQFHDVIPGSSIASVYQDTNTIYEHVEFEGAKILYTALGDIFGIPPLEVKLSQNNAPSQAPAGDVILFNTTPYERQEVLAVPWDGEVNLDPQAGVIAVCVKGFSMAALSANRIPFNPKLMNSVALRVNHDIPDSSRHYIMENKFIRVHFDSCGHITSIHDKEVDREVIPAGERANRFMMYEDLPQVWDAWDVEIHHLNKGWSVSEDSSKITLKIGLEGPLLASLYRRIEVSKSCIITQVISLTFLSKRIDFTTNIDWGEEHRILKVEFPVAVKSSEATYDCPFGIVRRPTIMNTSWDVAKFEVCGHRFVDLSEYDYGVAILNDSKYGYSTRGNLIQLSLLRSPKLPDPECDMGSHIMKFAMFPHTGNVTTGHVVEEASTFNIPILWNSISNNMYDDRFLNEPLISFNWPKNAKLDPYRPSVPLAIEAIKKAEDDDNDIILRAYEPHGGRGTAILATHPHLQVSRMSSCNLLEESTNEFRAFVNESGDWSIDFKPFQIITLRLSVELINLAHESKS